MYAFAINEKMAFAVVGEGFNDVDKDDIEPSSEEPQEPTVWRHFFISFDPELRVKHFRTPAGGIVYSATVNPDTGAIWMLARNRLYLLSRSTGEIFHAPLPEDRLAVFEVTEIAGRYYFCCSYGRIWCYDGKQDVWTPLVESDPRPKREPRRKGESVEEYVDRTTPASEAYIERFPDFFHAFAVGDDLYFLADLGRVVIRSLRGETSNEIRFESGASLVGGHAEGNQAVICGSAPVAEIYRGTFENGFERIFQNDEKSLHLTALHDGTRYIGASVYPGFNGPSLFTYDGQDLVPVVTGCIREPGNLLQLVATGTVLWAIDEKGFFRHTTQGWSLTEFSEVYRWGDQP